MEENRYFQEALASFAQEAANGGAIRHLADLGYTVRQITERLDFPAPYEKVRQAVWVQLTVAGVILCEEPGSGGRKERATYVKEYDRYGKATFRRVVKRDEGPAVICWKPQCLGGGQEAEVRGLLTVLQAKVKANGEENSYMSCDFGPMAKMDGRRYERMLQALDERTREYVLGLPWEDRRVYHRMNARMMAVLEPLCEKGLYLGECFFLRTGDRIRIGQAVGVGTEDREGSAVPVRGTEHTGGKYHGSK